MGEILVVLGLAAMGLFSVSFSATLVLEQLEKDHPGYRPARLVQYFTAILSATCVCLFWLGIMFVLAVELQRMLQSLSGDASRLVISNPAWWY